MIRGVLKLEVVATIAAFAAITPLGTASLARQSGADLAARGRAHAPPST